jgi:hypothetical protein
MLKACPLMWKKHPATEEMASSGWRSALARFWLVMAGGLLLMGLWRFGSIEQARQQVPLQQAHRLSMLTRFQMEVAHCERLVVALGASEARSVQVGGVNPRALHPQLQRHAAEAARLFSMLHAALAPMLQESDVPQSLRWAFVRVEAEWLQLYASLREYLARADGQVSLETLHAFLLPHQDSLHSATESLHDSLTRWHQAEWSALRRQQGLALGLCLIGSALLLGWVWRFVVRPARLMRRWLRQFSMGDHPVAPTLLTDGIELGEQTLRQLDGSDWEPLMRTLLQQRQRLREVERFMRDLAMGRTPEPLAAQQPSDPLARSSFWLIRRVEEWRRAQQEREAV